MEIINDDNLDIVYSHNFQEAEDLKTVLIKEDKLLLTNVTYSINMKLQKKFEIKKVYQHRGYYDQYSQFIFEKVYAEGCTVGIKRITQCLDEYANEEILTITTEELQKIYPSPIIFNVYPFEQDRMYATG
ncbi:uncharacterized protein LOC112682211 [Sipha flava]|uniref:Uncharacterized protein LOC112682211 n=1 Tax=Sipha flava TaxID=143950 RepID=A0A8B8FDI7_9HEMI|nr:uncharacterized protein LOC112682211 [Sipha flava]